MALAAQRAGHQIVGIVAGPSGFVPAPLVGIPLVSGPLPAADLVLVAVRDDAIESVAHELVGRVASVRHVCHLSGFTTVEALSPLRSADLGIGSFHPVQSLPDPDPGSSSLAGSFAALTGDPSTLEVLRGLAASIGMTPLDLEDSLKPLHHAAAAAASNFVNASLVLASKLGSLAGVPPEAYRALTNTSVANGYELGAMDALTGPIARGDVGTVAGQLDAVEAASPALAPVYASMVDATARLTRHYEVFDRLLRSRS